jgi:hypothetical protein
MAFALNIPGLGPVTRTPEGWYRSAAVTVPALGRDGRGATCHVLLDGYDDDPAKDEFHAVIARFLTIGESVLKAAARPIFEYYQDITSCLTDDEISVSLSSPDEVWEHIHAGDEVFVKRESHRDRHVYISVEFVCDWEPEHGLQIVFRGGQVVTRVGPYDGRLTNAAAYAGDDLAGVVYHRRR